MKFAMSDLSNAIPIINAYFPAGLRRCVNVRKVYDFLDMGDSSSHWFKRVVMSMNHCVKGDDYVIVRISSAPIVLENETFYVYDGPRTGIDILCVVEKIIPAVRKTHSSNAYVVANYLTNALTKEEPIEESDYMFDEFCTKPLHRVVVPPQAQEHETQEQPQEPSQIKLFENEQFGSVRVVMRGDDPWFVAKDVAVCLGYTDPKRAVYDHCKKAETYSQFGEPLNIGGVETTPPVNSGLPQGCSPLDPQTKLIPESDLYRLIMRSHLPAAEEFQDWVVEEVLPAIRKTGSYSTKSSVPYALYITDAQGKRYRYSLDK